MAPQTCIPTSRALAGECRLGKQLKGLRRAASMRLRKFSRSGRAPYTPEPPMVRVPLADVFHAEAVTEEEKRFLRCSIVRAPVNRRLVRRR